MILANGFTGTDIRKKREAERVPFRPDIPCEVLAADSRRSWAAWVRDVSGKGISLLLETQFEVGVRLVVATSLPGKRALQKQVEVRHSEICFPNNAWLHGCQFSEPLTEEELAQISWKAASPDAVSEEANAE